MFCRKNFNFSIYAWRW